MLNTNREGTSYKTDSLKGHIQCDGKFG